MSGPAGVAFVIDTACIESPLETHYNRNYPTEAEWRVVGSTKRPGRISIECVVEVGWNPNQERRQPTQARRLTERAQAAGIVVDPNWEWTKYWPPAYHGRAVDTEENPKKTMTHDEVTKFIDDGGDPMTVVAYELISGSTIYRTKWTRVRPGLYRRILGEYEVTVEECDPGVNCAENERGWILSYQPLYVHGPREEHGRWDWPIPTYREAKAVAEEQFSNKRIGFRFNSGKLKAKLLR